MTKRTTDTYLGSHDCDLSRRPRVVDVASHVLRVHDTVGAAVSLASDHGDLRHRRLGVGKYQLRSVTNYAVVFLVRSCTYSQTLLSG